MCQHCSLPEGVKRIFLSRFCCDATLVIILNPVLSYKTKRAKQTKLTAPPKLAVSAKNSVRETLIFNIVLCVHFLIQSPGLCVLVDVFAPGKNPEQLDYKISEAFDGVVCKDVVTQISDSAHLCDVSLLSKYLSTSGLQSDAGTLHMSDG